LTTPTPPREGVEKLDYREPLARADVADSQVVVFRWLSNACRSQALDKEALALRRLTLWCPVTSELAIESRFLKRACGKFGRDHDKSEIRLIESRFLKRACGKTVTGNAQSAISAIESRFLKRSVWKAEAYLQPDSLDRDIESPFLKGACGKTHISADMQPIVQNRITLPEKSVWKAA
jgi:hypothetical protein